MASKSKEAYLQELILKQGLILESEVYSLLARHFALKINPSSKIGYILGDQEGNSQEVDVFAAIYNEMQVATNPFFNTINDNNRSISLSKAMNIFLIECKGHSSEGILLCRLHHQPNKEKILLTNHLSHYIHTGAPTSFNIEGLSASLNTPGRWLQGINKLEVQPIVDSCAFYSFSNQKGFTEDKSKLFKATQQISSAGRLFDKVLNNWHRGEVSTIRAYTVTPIICTNIPITIMQIEKEEVHLTEVEWAYLLNPQYGNEPILPNRPDYRLIPVVQSASLTRFCDAIMSDKPDTLSVSKGKTLHSFNIKDAQQIFESDG